MKSFIDVLGSKNIQGIVNNYELSEAEKGKYLLVKVSHRLFAALIVILVLGFVTILILSNAEKPEFVTLPIVMLSGILGGFVGIQSRLKDLTVSDLELLAISRVYLCLAPLVGGVLALVLYILFISNLLSGELFPEIDCFKKTGSNCDYDNSGFFSIMEQYAVDGHRGYGKLMFWCFLAGYSERFVTDVIGKFEGRAIKTLDQPVPKKPKKDQAQI